MVQNFLKRKTLHSKERAIPYEHEIFRNSKKIHRTLQPKILDILERFLYASPLRKTI